MTAEERGPDQPRPDETYRRDAVRDQSELDRARGGHKHPPHPPPRGDLLPGTRAWRTDHTEVMLVESSEVEVHLRLTDLSTGRYVQAPLTADDLEIVAHILQLHAARLRRLAERR